jgi:hypothetical protein
MNTLFPIIERWIFSAVILMNLGRATSVSALPRNNLRRQKLKLTAAQLNV